MNQSFSGQFELTQDDLAVAIVKSAISSIIIFPGSYLLIQMGSYLQQKPSPNKSTLDIAITNTIFACLIATNLMYLSLLASFFFDNIEPILATFMNIIGSLIISYFYAAALLVQVVTFGFLKFFNLMNQVTDFEMKAFCYGGSSLLAILTFAIDNLVLDKGSNSALHHFWRNSMLDDRLGIMTMLIRSAFVISLIIVLIVKTTMADNAKKEFLFLAKTVVGISIVGMSISHAHIFYDFGDEFQEFLAIVNLFVVIIIVPMVIICRNENMSRFVFPSFFNHQGPQEPPKVTLTPPTLENNEVA